MPLTQSFAPIALFNLRERTLACIRSDTLVILRIPGCYSAIIAGTCRARLSMGDGIWLSAAISGDEPEADRRDVRAEINPTLWKSVFGFAYSLVRNHAQAEDLTQEAFIVLLREEKAGRSVARVDAWLRIVVKNLLYHDRLKFRPGLHISWDQPAENGQPLLHEPMATEPSPEEKVIEQAMMRLAAEVLDGFSPQDRECILMYFRGCDFLQIGGALGISRWKARRTTLRAMNRFRLRMK